MSPYEILGVKPTDSPEQIKTAYRKAAMKYHPDRVDEANRPSMEEQFKRIKNAYEAITKGEILFSDSANLTLKITIPQSYKGYTHTFTYEGFDYKVELVKGVRDFHRSVTLTSLCETRKLKVNLTVLITDSVFSFIDNNLQGMDCSGDVITTISLDVLDLILGCTITIDDPHGGRCMLRIPEGFNAGLLKVSKRGSFAWRANSSKALNRLGDLYVKVQPIISKAHQLDAQKLKLINERKNA